MYDKELIKSIISNAWGYKFNQFRNCQAYVSEPIFKEGIIFQLVKSYKTIVAFVNLSDKEYIELGKWSVTTSQQQTKIYNAMYSNFKREFVDIRN